MRVFMVCMWVVYQPLLRSWRHKKEEMKEFTIDLLEELYELETALIEEIYDPVDLSHDVKIFVHNANKALMNLAYEPYFEYEEVNPVA